MTQLRSFWPSLSLWLVVTSLLVACAAPQAQRPDSNGAHPPATATAALAARAASTASAARAPEASKPLFLWKLKGPSAQVFLLGSIHVAASDLYPLDERIEAAFASSDHLVLETDLDDPRFADVMTQFVERALLPRGQTVFDKLEPALSKRLQQRIVELELDQRQVEAFEPWFVAMTLSLTELSRAGYTGDNGIDSYFQRRARGKMPILALEPLDLQMRLLVQMGESGGIQDIELALDNDEVAEIRRSLKYWQHGDTAGLATELVQMQQQAPLLYDAMFTQRNIGMAQEIRRLLTTSGTYFVIVGAGHLVGAGSVIELLEQLSSIRVQVEQVGAAQGFAAQVPAANSAGH